MNRTGRTDIYSYDTTEHAWIPIGQPLLGINPGDEFGYSISMSYSGHFLAIGAPGFDSSSGAGGDDEGVILQDAGQIWGFIQMGVAYQPLGSTDGMFPNLNFGLSISLGHSGWILAIGMAAKASEPSSVAMVVRADTLPSGIDMNGNGWFKISSLPYDTAWNVRLSADEQVLTYSSYCVHPTDGTQVGTISIFSYRYSSTDDIWTPLGEAIPIQESHSAASGHGFVVSNDGMRVFVGHPGDSAALTPGVLHLYEYDSDLNDWSEAFMPLEISGNDQGKREGSSSSFGASLDMNGYGDFIVVGSPHALHNDVPVGKVEVFRVEKN